MINDAMEITKVKNIYIMLLNAISKENISIVDHYLDDKLAASYKQMIDTNSKKGVRQVFRQLNITDVTFVGEYTDYGEDSCEEFVEDEPIDNSETYVQYSARVRYITYFVDRNTDKYVSGDNKTRISKNVNLTFRKNNYDHRILNSCPNCGAGLNINNSAICKYCGAAIDERFSPFVLCKIE